MGVTEPSGGLADPTIDNDADFVDWIELYNSTSNTLSLKGWSITDSRKKIRKWIFPEMSLAGGDYLVLLASGQDVNTPDGSYLHTNFKLSAKGEYLGLYDANGILVHELGGYPPQVFSHTYGLASSSNQGVYFDIATPGSANTGNEFTGIMSPPEFSHSPGFYSDDVLLDLWSTQDAATIRYTTDGSVPTLDNGQDYTSPVVLTESTVIRARAFRSGWIPSATVTRSYLIKEPEALQSMCSISLVADPNRSLYKPYGVTSIVGGTGLFGAWRALGPSDYNITLNRGRAFEKQASLEIFPPDQDQWYQDDIGIRISGSDHTRGQYLLTNLRDNPWFGIWREKPSLGLFFRKDYDQDRLEFPLIPGYEQTHFESLKLRAGKVDWENPFFIDELMRRLFVDMDQVGSLGTMVNLFVNGQFKCYYNLAEKIREPFLQMRHASQAKWDVITDGLPEEGDTQNWDNMLSFFATHPIKTVEDFQTASEYLDLVNFIDYLLINLYGANWDWPEQNYLAAKERTEGSLFRFYVWDAEACLDISRTDPGKQDAFTEMLKGKDPSPIGLIYQAISASPEFRILFSDRLQKHFFNNGALTQSNISNQMTLLTETLNPSLQYVRGKDGINLEPLLDWVEIREAVFLAQCRREGLWPSLLAPTINQWGGQVPFGFEVTLSNPNKSGDIYMTTDSTDPRGAGGSLQGQQYVTPIAITADGPVQARTYDGHEWSPLLNVWFEVTP